ncbi:hypothetical protein SAMN05661093_06652 [Kibdelosporangium aridum]|uniref:Uncharacterized protein n=1 Tax=Kibdelosporangium aridum TaxID=2030 RepID=A0A1W2FGW0_KIBAR|nr:hypothetical protein SAMN05661093_06652 [Kibdelosporangium aridum]
MGTTGSDTRAAAVTLARAKPSQQRWWAEPTLYPAMTQGKAEALPNNATQSKPEAPPINGRRAEPKPT